MLAELKPLGPYFVGQIVDYVGTQASARPRYQLSLRRWYVVQTEPQQESNVEKALDDAKFGCYCPRVPGKTRIIRERYRMVSRPMLRGYLFAGFDPANEPWQAILDIRGVLRLFMIDSRPVPVGEYEMQCVREAETRERMGKDRKPVKAALPKVNDLIQVNNGPFAMFFGIVTEVDQRRYAVKAELNIFGRLTPAWFEGEQVEVVLDKPVGLVAIRNQYKRPRSPR